MVAIDYLELIEKGVKAWNHWRSEHPEARPDLKTAYLFEKSLPGINLSHVNLSRACLIGADLRNADLTGAKLSGVYANNANFRGASLAAADLRGGNLVEANLRQANLSGAVVDDTNFTNACLIGTCLEGWSAEAADLSDPQQPLTDQSVSAAQRQPLAEPPSAHQASPASLAQTQTSTAARVKSLRRLPVVLGVGAIAFSTAATAVYFTTRSGSAEPVITLEPKQVALVCNEPPLTPLVTEKPDYKYQDGTRFYGQFVDGKPLDGRGSMIYTSGNRYDGQYANGRRNGCGTFTFANGRRYIGEFKDDLFSGRGTWLLENGDRYMGDFEYNKCNGEGVFIFANGSSKSGVWQQGRLVGSDLSCDRGPADIPES